MAKKNDIGEIAAMAALGGATGFDDEMKALLKQALKDKLAESQREKDEEIAWRKSNIATLNEARAEAKAEKAACPHRKENQATALAGQHIGKGVFCFVCLKCQQEFHKPAVGNQIEPPLALVPTEYVGGPSFA